MSSANIETVKMFYQLWDQGKVNDLLELCTSDLVWIYPVVKYLPYSGRFLGRAEVTRFFSKYYEIEEVIDLKQANFLEQENSVGVLGLLRARDRYNGRVWQSNYAHLFFFQNGRIQRFEALFDTAAAQEAHHPD